MVGQISDLSDRTNKVDSAASTYAEAQQPSHHWDKGPCAHFYIEPSASEESTLPVEYRKPVRSAVNRTYNSCTDFLSVHEYQYP